MSTFKAKVIVCLMSALLLFLLVACSNNTATRNNSTDSNIDANMDNAEKIQEIEEPSAPTTKPELPGESEDEHTLDKDEPYKIAYIGPPLLGSQRPFITNYFQEYVSEYNFQLHYYDVYDYPLSEVLRQSSEDDCDAIIVALYDLNDSIIQSLKEVHAAGKIIGMFGVDLPLHAQQYRHFFVGKEIKDAGEEAAKAFVSAFPDGARANVYFKKGEDYGHVVIGEKINGNFIFYDPQENRLVTINEILKHDNFGYCRMDNLRIDPEYDITLIAKRKYDKFRSNRKYLNSKGENMTLEQASDRFMKFWNSNKKYPEQYSVIVKSVENAGVNGHVIEVEIIKIGNKPADDETRFIDSCKRWFIKEDGSFELAIKFWTSR